MREQRLFHARHEHAVELEALGRVDRHERDGLVVFGRGRIKVGTKANPLDEVGQGIRRKLAHGGKGVVAGDLRFVFHLMRLHVFVDDGTGIP